MLASGTKRNTTIMEQNINLLISGKKNRFALDGFIAVLGLEAKLQQGPLPFSKALEALSADEDDNLLLGITHRGQHILLEDRSSLLEGGIEKHLLAFTRAERAEALALTLGDEAGVSWFNYYRDGKLARSVTIEGAEADEIGLETPYEQDGFHPESVLAAFCDSWKALQKLEWEVYVVLV